MFSELDVIKSSGVDLLYYKRMSTHGANNHSGIQRIVHLNFSFLTGEGANWRDCTFICTWFGILQNKSRRSRCLLTQSWHVGAAAASGGLCRSVFEAAVLSVDAAAAAAE